MSRLKKFTASLFSGYLALAANIAYSVALIPIALHYLSKPEFGLWNVALQISGYIMLIDLGMSGSISRVLIDHKDDPEGGAYGGLIKTGALVGVVQGVIVVCVGGALAVPLGYLLDVPVELRRDLTILIAAQSALLGVSFATRIFYHLLVAHQRYDIANYCQMVTYGLSIAGMWACFAAGWGVFSLLAVQAASAILTILVTWLACVKLKLFPKAGQWGRASWESFKSLFSYGRDLFLYSVGMQFIGASQVIILTRFMGLEVAAVWSVGSKIYNMLGQIIWRIQDYAGPPLAEMFVQGQPERMLNRLRDLAVLTTNLSIAAGVMIAVCNTSFMQVLTSGKIEWAPANDLLLGFWLIVGTAMRAHITLAGAIKRFGFFSYIFLIEGCLFLGLNIALRNLDGITRMITLSILCTACLSLPYAHWRTRRYFSLPWREVVGWYESSGQLALRLVPVAMATWWATRGLEPVLKVALNGFICGTLGAFILVRYGLGEDLKGDIAGKLPSPIRRLFLTLSGRKLQPA
jgi:O-antigen/teichoic acid export membrane protein